MGEKGQALLVVILTMVVSLTVGLSLASRSITNLRISTSQEESQKAFSAAEAGIEEALKSGVSIAEQTLPNNAKYSASVVGAALSEFVVPGIAGKDEPVQIWLGPYPIPINNQSWGYGGGNYVLYWGNPADACPDAAALEVIVFSAPSNSPNVTHYAFDPCDRGNNFTKAFRFDSPQQIQGTYFRYTVAFNVPQGLFIRIIPLYKSTTLAIKPSPGSLPSQGKEIEAVGKVISGGEEVVRKIKVFQSYPTLPGYFDYALFSGTSL